MSSTFGGGGMDGGNFRSSSTSTRYQNGRKIVTQKYVFMRAFKNLEPLAYAHIFRLELPYLWLLDFSVIFQFFVLDLKFFMFFSPNWFLNFMLEQKSFLLEQQPLDEYVFAPVILYSYHSCLLIWFSFGNVSMSVSYGYPWWNMFCRLSKFGYCYTYSSILCSRGIVWVGITQRGKAMVSLPHPPPPPTPKNLHPGPPWVLVYQLKHTNGIAEPI